MAHYNLDIKSLFGRAGRDYLNHVKLEPADRFEVSLLCQQLDQLDEQKKSIEKELEKLADSALPVEREARAILKTAPYIGPVTAEAILSELGDVRRFSNHRQVSKYAGLDPKIRASGKNIKQMSIVKAGSPLLRWELIETAWRWSQRLPHWRAIFDRLCNNTGSRKKAIVALARRILGVLFSMLKNGQRYRPDGVINPGGYQAQ